MEVRCERKRNRTEQNNCRLLIENALLLWIELRVQSCGLENVKK